jgi:hypothetical protein
VVWSAEHTINVIDNIVIPRSVVPTVPDYFFQAYTGSRIHLVWSSDCCVNRQESISSTHDKRLQCSSIRQRRRKSPVGWLVLLMPALVNNSVWATKSVTSGVSDAYIESDAISQILSVSYLSVCAPDYNLRADLVDFFIGTHRTTPVGRV